jgi:hypothetical protein
MDLISYRLVEMPYTFNLLCPALSYSPSQQQIPARFGQDVRDTQVQAMILRLACCDDMRPVWRELYKRNVCVRQPNAWAKYLKMFGQMPATDADPHDIAACIIYYQAECLAEIYLAFNKSEEWLNKARGLGDLSSIIDPDAIPVMRRDRGKRTARTFAAQIAATTKALYGRRMFSTVAAVVNVALDLKGRQRITRENVRDWPSHE